MAIDVFISHHTKSSLSIVESIANKLESNGIQCWYAPRNTTGSYAKSISDAIDGCKIFVLVLNKFSSESVHVLNELELVFSRVNNREDVCIIPFHIADDINSISREAQYYIRRLHWMNAKDIPMENSIDELLKRITLELSSCQNEKSVKEHNTISIKSSTVYSDINFVGRNKEIKAIHDTINGYVNKVFVSGIGGVGKSELVKKYVQTYIDEYDTVIWIPFKKSLLETFVDDISLPIDGIRREDYTQLNDLSYFNKKLHCLKSLSNKKVLLIIDNFNVASDEHLEEICNGEYSIIFTTKNRNISNIIPEISINSLNDEKELLELFKLEYKRPIAESDIEIIKNIISFYNGHTLSIRLIAGTMQSQRISPANMLGILNNHKHNRISSSREQTTADIIYNRIKNVFILSNLSETEKSILVTLSLVPSCGIDVSLLFSLCEIDDFSIIDSLIDKNWVEHNVISDEVFLHPLISDLARELLENVPSMYSIFIRNLYKMNIESGRQSDYETKKTILKLSDSICNNIPSDNFMYVESFLCCGYAMIDASRYFDATECFNAAFDKVNDIVDKIKCIERISQCYILSGSWQKAVEFAEKGWELVKNLEFDHITDELSPFYINLLHRFIEAYMYLKDYKSALYYGNICSSACDALFSERKHEVVAWSNSLLGRLLFLSGNKEESLYRLNMAFKQFDEAGDNHGIACVYDYLSLIMSDNGNFDEAIKTIQRAKEIKIQLVGENHIGVANTCKILGDIYFKNGNFEHAKEAYLCALKIYNTKNYTALENIVSEILKSMD